MDAVQVLPVVKAQTPQGCCWHGRKQVSRRPAWTSGMEVCHWASTGQVEISFLRGLLQQRQATPLQRTAQSKGRRLP